LKWVNDLVAGGRKVGGILAEMPSIPAQANGRREPALVFGVGINIQLNESEIPEEIRDNVEWLERLSKRPVDPNQILAAFALQFENLMESISAGRQSEILAEWKRHSATLGREIKATTGGTTIEGKAVDLSATGGLIVETAQGERVTLHAGEVTIRGADGSYV
jgi:BirA family biotin operon repressor/biotin-[acetyl-CoA-carboxylase] ligase